MEGTNGATVLTVTFSTYFVPAFGTLHRYNKTQDELLESRHPPTAGPQKQHAPYKISTPAGVCVIEDIQHRLLPAVCCMCTQMAWLADMVLQVALLSGPPCMLEPLASPMRHRMIRTGSL
jgi:hypothetical protein